MWVQKIKLPPFYDTFLYLNKELRFNDVGTKRDIAKCQYCQIPKNELHLIICQKAGEVGVPNI